MTFLKPVLNGVSYIGGCIGSGFYAIGSSIKNISFSTPKPYKIEGPITYQRLMEMADRINKLIEIPGDPRLTKTSGDALEVDEDTSWRQFKDRIGVNQPPELISRYVFEFFKKAYEDLPKTHDEDQKKLQTTILALDKQAKISEKIYSKESKKNYHHAMEIIHNLIFKEKINQYLEMLTLAKDQTAKKKITIEDFKSYCVITLKILGNTEWFGQWYADFKKDSQLDCAQPGKDLIAFLDPKFREEDSTDKSTVFVD